MLAAKDIEALKAVLEAERARLEDEIAEYEREGQETLSDVSGENNYRDHMADQGSATFARELDKTLEENARESLARVRAALARIDAGEYGVCRRCGTEIPLERLKAVPDAELCVSCKAQEESL
ncbi:MAG: TraR/DksA C4-type zinc finger protein [Coriobacteriia bacterium]|nr:TraR/DksA C4-type zinc finger protein [Coriobacteriia bacterium]MDI6844291.1 TraR/DksA C4-type zinc finger protein [Anaerosomatales bacterium]